VRRPGVLILFLVVLLTACSQFTPKVVKETVIVYVTQPPQPTYTPYPTYTPVPPAPTYTLYPTQMTTPSPSGGTTPQVPPSSYLGDVRKGGRLGKTWNLANVRCGLHSDRLRVVWELAEPGDHLPLFEVVEVDNALDPFPTGHDPSWGTARIDLVVSDLYAYDFPLGERLPLIPSDNPRVTRIGLYPTFSDAHLGFSIGLKVPSAYKVYELTNPVRIVIDVLFGD
jgi:hypothetical protein